MATIVITPYASIQNRDYFTDTLITIDPSSFTGAQFVPGKATFSFIECHFEKVTIENLAQVPFEEISIIFLDCDINNVVIENIVSDNISISFLSSVLSGVIKCPNISSVNINNCIARDGLFLLNQKNVYILYSEENISPRRWLRLLNRVGYGFLTLIKTKQSFYIHDAKRLTFKTNENRGQRTGFYQQAPSGELAYFLKAEEKKFFNLNLSLKYSNIEDRDALISGSYLNSVSLSGNFTGTMSIEDTKISNWYISEFIAKGDISFYGIQPIIGEGENKIGIHKCDLDNVWFDNVDFDRYQIISFYRTKFSKTTFTSCNFPNEYASFERFMPIENVHYPERRNQNHHKGQYEIFLQLRKSLEGTGNYFEAQKLQAIGHDALAKIESIPRWDKFILKIGSWSNNHGLSIAPAFRWFMLFSISLYIFYLWSLDRIFNSNEIDYRLIGYYFSFIDITHRNDFLAPKEEFTWLSLTIDYFAKIVLSFLIYQFVVAFRKYGKK